MNGNNFMITCIEESNLVHNIMANRRPTQRLSSLHIPYHQSIIILSAHRRQILLVERERQALNQDLMQPQSMDDPKRIKVPDNDLRLEPSVSLARSHVLAGIRNSEHGDIVVMASQELLGSSNDVSNDDGRAEREQYVLVVWVQNQPVVHLS